MEKIVLIGLWFVLIISMNVQLVLVVRENLPKKTIKFETLAEYSYMK